MPQNKNKIDNSANKKNTTEVNASFKKLDPKSKKEYDKYKQKYFDYYDDVKSHTHDIYDW